MILDSIEKLLIHASEHKIFKAHTTLFQKVLEDFAMAKILLSSAIEYEIMPEGVINEHRIGPITIRRQLWPKGVVKWAIHSGQYVLDRDGDWRFEPTPSSRTEEFLQETRFDFDDAWQRANKVAETEVKEAGS